MWLHFWIIFIDYISKKKFKNIPINSFQFELKYNLWLIVIHMVSLLEKLGHNLFRKSIK